MHRNGGKEGESVAEVWSWMKRSESCLEAAIEISMIDSPLLQADYGLWFDLRHCSKIAGTALGQDGQQRLGRKSQGDNICSSGPSGLNDARTIRYKSMTKTSRQRHGAEAGKGPTALPCALQHSMASQTGQSRSDCQAHLREQRNIPGTGPVLRRRNVMNA